MTKVRFECSHGDFVAEINEDWAPLGAGRFLELVRDGYFEEIFFFRVVTRPRPFVIQFGIHGDPDVSAKWRNATIKDDAVRQSNAPGTLTFATSGPNSRTTQLFINLGDNSFLDSQGFSPIGRITEGMEVVKTIHDSYGESPNQGAIQMRGNEYLKSEFPKMDYIKRIVLIED